MKRKLTLEYWQEEGWYVGRLKGIPGVFSQGQTLQALEDNVREAYQLMMEDEPVLNPSDLQSKELETTLKQIRTAVKL